VSVHLVAEQDVIEADINCEPGPDEVARGHSRCELLEHLRDLLHNHRGMCPAVEARLAIGRALGYAHAGGVRRAVAVAGATPGNAMLSQCYISSVVVVDVVIMTADRSLTALVKWRACLASSSVADCNSAIAMAMPSPDECSRA